MKKTKEKQKERKGGAGRTLYGHNNIPAGGKKGRGTKQEKKKKEKKREGGLKWALASFVGLPLGENQKD